MSLPTLLEAVAVVDPGMGSLYLLHFLLGIMIQVFGKQGKGESKRRSRQLKTNERMDGGGMVGWRE